MSVLRLKAHFQIEAFSLTNHQDSVLNFSV
jgi:hypothetical protein